MPPRDTSAKIEAHLDWWKTLGLVRKWEAVHPGRIRYWQITFASGRVVRWRLDLCESAILAVHELHELAKEPAPAS